MDDGTEALLRYIDQLERAIIVADESSANDPSYSLRVIRVMAARIMAAEEAAEAAAAAARWTVH